MNAQQQMKKLFEVYNQQCSDEKINYTASEIRNNKLQSWIVMDGIELSFMTYQEVDQPIFMCNRYCEKYGDQTYYFKTYNQCKLVRHMNDDQLSNYADSLQHK